MTFKRSYFRVVLFLLLNCKFSYSYSQNINIDFNPSFHLNAQTSVDFEGDSAEIHIDFLRSTRDSQIIQSFVYQLKSSECEFIASYLEDRKNIAPKTLGFDGLGVVIAFKDNSEDIAFTMSSIESETEEFIDKYIDFIRRVSNDRKVKKYCRILKQYY